MDNDPELKANRRAQIAATHNAIANQWPAIHAELQHRIDMLIQQLIDQNDDKIRGRIQELQSLQRLPQDIRNESERLESVIIRPEDPVELTGTLGEY